MTVDDSRESSNVYPSQMISVQGQKLPPGLEIIDFVKKLLSNTKIVSNLNFEETSMCHTFRCYIKHIPI